MFDQVLGLVACPARQTNRFPEIWDLGQWGPWKLPGSFLFAPSAFQTPHTHSQGVDTPRVV